MKSRLRLHILPQPDDSTCGPTCLQAVYQYYGTGIPLSTLISEVPLLEGGGTLGVWLGCHALRSGFNARLYTYNLQVFDPTWFAPGVDLSERLTKRLHAKRDQKMRRACQAYLDFLHQGGEIRYRDLTSRLIRKYLKRGVPILTGLSATYLYAQAREHGPRADSDDLRGDPTGHFVVLCGYDQEERKVLIADPWKPNPSGEQLYERSMDTVINAILLGVLTYDGNLLVITPKTSSENGAPLDPDAA